MKFLTVDEVAGKLQVSQEVVQALISGGRLKAFDHTAALGTARTRRVLSQDLESYIESLSPVSLPSQTRCPE